MLDKFFISKVRVKILKLFLLNVNSNFHVREIVRQVGEEINAVRRILNELENTHFLISERNGNRLYYRLNKDFEFFTEFISLFNKEFGLGERIIKHKSKLGNIKLAFFTNTYIQSKRKNEDDLDLVILGNNINFIYLEKLIKEYEDSTNKNINYTYLSQGEFDIYKKDPYFLNNIINKEKIILIGEESFVHN
jgi:hypothetical protein